MIKTFFYAIGQGFRNLFRYKGHTAASIATISACLFLFGVVFAIVLNVDDMIKEAQKDVSVTVFFQEGTSEEEIMQLKIAIEERTDEVSGVTYVSADEAWAEFSQEYLGDYADGFTENPLEDSENLVINLNDVSKQADLVNYLEGIDIVREVNRSELTADALSGASSLIAYASVAIIAILFLVSYFLIRNTVANGINSHRDEIAIMKYIGATDFYVQAPYVFEGILIGLIGAALPIGVVYYLYNYVVDYVQNRFAVLNNMLTFLPVTDVFRLLIPVSVILGIGIGFLGSSISVRKHLHV